MKFNFTAVAASILFSGSLFPTSTNAAEDFNVGLSNDFWTRAAKAVAASGLSMNPEYNDKDPIQEVDYLSQFSDEVKWEMYREVGVDEGLNDAILVEDEGQCFVAFQCTSNEWDDILSNANPFPKTICNDADKCCTYSEVFVNGWDTQWQEQMETNVKDCVARCTKDPCLIVTGLSQGGGVAVPAAFQLADITSSYEVITFAAPPAFRQEPEECLPETELRKYYRFGATQYKSGLDGGLSGLVFDKVPFLGPPIPGVQTWSVGEFLILSAEDFDNVAYVGFNTEVKLTPWDNYPPPLGNAHEIWNANPKLPGYYQIMAKILAEGTFPIGVKGFDDDFHCGVKEYGSFLCKTERCVSLGMDLHSVCKIGKEIGEGCLSDFDCNDGLFCPAGAIRTCEALRGPGEPCASDSNCIEGYFCPGGVSRNCETLRGPGDPCAASSNCIEGYYCPAGLSRKCATDENYESQSILSGQTNHLDRKSVV